VHCSNGMMNLVVVSREKRSPQMKMRGPVFVLRSRSVCSSWIQMLSPAFSGSAARVAAMYKSDMSTAAGAESDMLTEAEASEDRVCE
jgi:hypothetical protein